MSAIRKNETIPEQEFAFCHDGEGVLLCQSLLDGENSREFAFLHSDRIAAGVSIGDHSHPANEEIYYLVSGRGVLTYDGIDYDMAPGDVSLCARGHSHAFRATEDSRLIVVGGTGQEPP